MPIHGTPFAIVDFETTGINPEADRVVEVAIRRFDPTAATVTAFDSLVDPQRAMGATQRHGIREEDVRDAPTFRDLAPTVMTFLAGAVLGSYNVRYDARFLTVELSRLGINVVFPQVCLMLMKPLLGLGARRSLPDACRELGVGFDGDHHLASADAEAAERLLHHYLGECSKQGLTAFGDLERLGKGEFLQTLSHPLLPSAKEFELTGSAQPHSRLSWPQAKRAVPGEAAVKTYFDALVGVLADGVVTEAELTYMKELQGRLVLTSEQLRALHARAFLCVMMNFIGDDWLETGELEQLTQASTGLARLGWTPGIS